MVKPLVQRFHKEVAQPLREIRYLLADTRIKYVSLYDHLVLTAGIGIALVQELRHRGCTAAEICGLPVAEEDLLPLARLCGLLHDIGKAHVGQTEYHSGNLLDVRWEGLR